MSKKEVGNYISTKARLIVTFNQNESISEEFHTLLHILLNTFETLMTTFWSLGARSPLKASGKNCCIRIWQSCDLSPPKNNSWCTSPLLEHVLMVFSNSQMVVEKVSNLVAIKTYGTIGFSIFPSLQRFIVNHKWGLIPLRCKSCLIFTLSFSLVTAFIIFFVKFCS